MKDKDGKEIRAGEFFSRWKEGVNKVTPLQQTQVSLYGYLFIFAGIIAGIIYAISGAYWWLAVILTGGLIVNLVGFLGILQRLALLKKQEEYIKQLSRVDSNNQQFKSYTG